MHLGAGAIVGVLLCLFILAQTTGGNATSAAPRAGQSSGPETPTVTATATVTATPTPRPPTPTPDIPMPIRSAFYYPWFPTTWGAGTFYKPDLGFYNSSNPLLIQAHIAAMQYANVRMGIASWWGQGTSTDGRIPALLQAAQGTGFLWSLYYEQEGTIDPTVNEINSDLTYILNNYGNDPNYLRINGRFVVFVYGGESCAGVDRWTQANTVGAYVVLKVFSGYRNCANQPEGWHQYNPGHAFDRQAGYSYTISPGFWNAYDEPVRLDRDIERFRQTVRDMTASTEPFHLITTFNEWGEGTAVENAQEWDSPSGYGIYLDALHDNGGPSPTPGGATATRTPTQTPTNTPSPTLTPTETPTGIVVANTPTATATPTPSMTGRVTWQGRMHQSYPIVLTMLRGTTVTHYPYLVTSASGRFTVPISALPPGTYTWWVKGPGYLANSGTVVLTGESPPQQEMGTMRPGDVNSDNVVDITDFTLQRNTFGRVCSELAYDARAEYNTDCIVDISDFTLLRQNFGQAGPPQPLGAPYPGKTTP